MASTTPPRSRNKEESDMSLLKDLFEEVSSIDKKLDLHLQEVRFELSRIKETDEVQNKLLSEHSQRSSELKRDNDLKEASLRADMKKLESRVDELSIPWKLARYLQIFAAW